MDTLSINYSRWKQLKTKLSLQPYYVGHTVVLVDLTRWFVYSSSLNNSDWANFTANIKPNAIAEDSIDACVVAVVIG